MAAITQSSAVAPRPAALPARVRSSTSSAVCTQARAGQPAQTRPAFLARRTRRSLRCLAQGEQGPGGENSPKEPAEDPSRPASAGRPAYEEDRQFFQQEGSSSQPKNEGNKPTGPGRKFGPFDGGVSGGQYGYGNVVDQAFKYLANADSFLLGGLFLVALFLALLAMGPPPSMTNDLYYR